MLQSLPQLRIALLNLLEQSHVLNRDHRLVSESLEKSDLLLRKRTHLKSAIHNDPNGSTLAQHRRRNDGTMSKAFLKNQAFRKLGFGFGCHVMDVDRLAVDDGPPTYRATIDGSLLFSRCLRE